MQVTTIQEQATADNCAATGARPGGPAPAVTTTVIEPARLTGQEG